MRMNASRKLILHRGIRRPRPMLTPEALELVAAGFRAMADPLRLRILHDLESGERSVSTLAAGVGTTQPNVSRHLKVLQNAGLVSRRPEGNMVYYSIADAMVLEICEMACSRLRDRLEAQVGALKPHARG